MIWMDGRAWVLFLNMYHIIISKKNFVDAHVLPVKMLPASTTTMDNGTSLGVRLHWQATATIPPTSVIHLDSRRLRHLPVDLQQCILAQQNAAQPVLSSMQ